MYRYFPLDIFWLRQRLLFFLFMFMLLYIIQSENQIYRDLRIIKANQKGNYFIFIFGIFMCCLQIQHKNMIISQFVSTNAIKNIWNLSFRLNTEKYINNSCKHNQKTPIKKAILSFLIYDIFSVWMVPILLRIIPWLE